MKSFFKFFLLCSLSFLFVTGNVTAQQTAQNNTAKTGEAFTVGIIYFPFTPSGSSNYLFSADAGGFHSQNYILYSDSNNRVAFMQINGNRERLTPQTNGEHLLIFSNKEYTVVVNETIITAQHSDEITKSAPKDDIVYGPLEGSFTISDMHGHTVIKQFVGAKETAVKE